MLLFSVFGLGKTGHSAADQTTCILRRSGFSLLEFLVVLALLAIVANFAIPSFIEQSSRNQATESTFASLSMLKLCRSQALTSLRSVQCTLDPTGTNLNTYLNIDFDGSGLFKLAESGIAKSNLVDYNFSTLINVTFDEYGYIDPLTSNNPDTLSFCGSVAGVGGYTIDLREENFLEVKEVSSASC